MAHPDISLWNGNSPHKELAEKLQALIPSMGEVENPRKNKCLERYRMAMNCYYDLYNNGLCNRKRTFSRMFKINVGDHTFYRSYQGVGGRTVKYPRFDERLYEAAEVVIVEILLAAVAEQKISV